MRHIRDPVPVRANSWRVVIDPHREVPGVLRDSFKSVEVGHRITAPYSGTVGALHFAEGDRAGKGDLLLDLAPWPKE